MKKHVAIICSFILLSSMSGCNKNKEDYEYLGQIAPYFHEVVYDDYTFDTDCLTVQDYIGSCSAVRNGNFVGRNFDYFYNDVPLFFVRVKAKKDRYASIGIAQTSLFKETDLLSNNVNKDYFKLIPNLMLDGINEKGVFVCNNVVSNEGKLNQGTDKSKEELGIWFISREILNRAATADEAISIMQSYNLVGDLSHLENLHFMIADQNKTYIVEIINESLVVQEKTGNEQIMTNFLCNQEQMMTYPAGVERYNILKENYGLGSTMKGMQDLLYKARFSEAFNPNKDPVWISDAGYFTYEETQNQDNIESYKNLLETEIYPAFTYDFNNNIRNNNPSDAWWITVHNSTYDIQNRSFKIFVQENYEQCFEFKLNG